MADNYALMKEKLGDRFNSVYSGLGTAIKQEKPNSDLEKECLALVADIETLKKSHPSDEDLMGYISDLNSRHEIYSNKFANSGGDIFADLGEAPGEEYIGDNDSSGRRDDSAGTTFVPHFSGDNGQRKGNKIGFFNRYPVLKKIGAVGASLAFIGMLIAGSNKLKSCGKDEPRGIHEIVQAVNCLENPLEGRLAKDAFDAGYLCSDDGVYVIKDDKPEIDEGVGLEDKECRAVMVRHPFDETMITEGKEGYERFAGENKALFLYPGASVDGSSLYNLDLSKRRGENVEDVGKGVSPDLDVEHNPIGETWRFAKTLKGNRATLATNMPIDGDRIGGHPEGLYGAEFNCDDALAYKQPEIKKRVSKRVTTPEPEPEDDKVKELTERVDGLEKQLDECNKRKCEVDVDKDDIPPVSVEPDDKRYKYHFPEFYKGGKEKVSALRDKEPEVEKLKDIRKSKIVSHKSYIEEGEVPRIEVEYEGESPFTGEGNLELIDKKTGRIDYVHPVKMIEEKDLGDGLHKVIYEGEKVPDLPDKDDKGNVIDRKSNTNLFEKEDNGALMQIEKTTFMSAVMDYFVGEAKASGGFGGILPYALTFEDEVIERIFNPECSDGIDNDLDNLVDKADPGCINAGVYDLDDDDEFNEIVVETPVDKTPVDVVPQCSDGTDNDGDGLIDKADPGCINAGVYDPDDNKEKHRDNRFEERITGDVLGGSGGYEWVNKSDSSRIKDSGNRWFSRAELGYNLIEDGEFVDTWNLHAIYAVLQDRASVDLGAGLDGNYKRDVNYVGAGIDLVLGKDSKTNIGLDILSKQSEAKRCYDSPDICGMEDIEGVVLSMDAENRDLIGDRIRFGFWARGLIEDADMEQGVEGVGVPQGGMSKHLLSYKIGAGPVLDVGKARFSALYLVKERPDIENDLVQKGNSVFGQFEITDKNDNTHLILGGEFPLEGDWDSRNLGVFFGQYHLKLGNIIKSDKWPGFEIGVINNEQELEGIDEVTRFRNLNLMLRLLYNFKDSPIQRIYDLLEFNSL